MSKKKKNIIPSNYSGSNDYYPENIDKISYKDEDSDYWQNFRNDVIKVREKSQDDFEKYLNVFGSFANNHYLHLCKKFYQYFLDSSH